MKPAIALCTFMMAMLAASCVTINVYFPEAQAEQAASRFIGGVWGSQPVTPPETESEVPAPPEEVPQSSSIGLLDFFFPVAYAQEDITISTPAIQAIQQRMRQRFNQHLKQYYEAGAIGLTNNALIAIRDLSSVPLSQRSRVNQLVAEENADRRAVYREIAVANEHPEWENRIRNIFAEKWIAEAQSGWWYQTESGEWVQK